MTYTWRSPQNARVAAALDARLESARLAELARRAEVRELAAELAAQRARGLRRRLLSPLTSEQFFIAAEASRLWALERWPDEAEAEASRLWALERWPDEAEADRRLAVLDDEVRQFQASRNPRARKPVLTASNM